MDISVVQSTASMEIALAHAQRLLDTDPDLAIRQALVILRLFPEQLDASVILARAHLAAGNTGFAVDLLRRLAVTDRRPTTLRALVDAEAAGGDVTRAIAALKSMLDSNEADASSLRLLAALLRGQGDLHGADAAHLAAVGASAADPVLIRAALALRDGRLHDAESALRAHLKAFPTDVAAIRMFAEVAGRIGRYRDAATLLERALELCPSFDEVRHGYALVLLRQNRPLDALAAAEQLLVKAPDDPGYRLLQAAALVRAGEQARACDVYEALVADHPGLNAAWLCLGHVRKALGRSAPSVAAYRRVTRQAPATGEAWWSLANLKTALFTADDAAAMRALLNRPNLGDDDRLHLHFALGKALEDAHGADGEAFAQYAAGNAIRRAQLRYDAAQTTQSCARAASLFDAGFLAARRNAGCPAADPIFIIGMPRSGSTLVEQILASHPLVEGTMELPDVMAIAARLDAPDRGIGGRGDPHGRAALGTADLRALGDEYLARTRLHRKTDRPRFVDKMPNNWLHVGLIMTMLPNARIVDVRRSPLACCWANYKQHFARGQEFSYDLAELGRYVRDYTALMDHFDTVAPGRVHRIDYEALVDDLEGETARLLAYCNLPYDPACLRFHENARTVRTASAEQVRQPIYRSGLDQWRRFERWLEPARRALEAEPAPQPEARAA